MNKGKTLKSLFLLVAALATSFICSYTFAIGLDSFKSTSNVVLAKSPALSCLIRTQGSIEQINYPQIVSDNKQSDTIMVRLVFHEPNQAPDIQINLTSTHSDLVDTVKDYVKDYRLPCMGANDAPVTLRQVYVFSPEGRKVLRFETVDEADLDRMRQFRCMININHAFGAEYSKNARRRNLEGKYYVKFTFDTPDAPPTLEWLANTDEDLLYTSVQRYVTGLRLPCIKNGPVSFTLFSSFAVETAPVFLKDMDLNNFLAIAKDIPRPVNFKLSNMNCPFNLRVRYFQPYSKNEVSVSVSSSLDSLGIRFDLQPYSESGVSPLNSVGLNRKSMIDWLSAITLNLNPTEAMSALGNIFTLRIPCGDIDR
jgi:hypothetical protein